MTMKNILTSNTFLVSTFLIVMAALSRLVPHLPNFTPIAAIGLFAAAYLGDRKLAVLISISAMLLSDVFIGFHSSMIWVYGAFLVIILGGNYLKNKVSVLNVFIASMASSIVFFLVTNFGVWIGSGMYSIDFKGFIECYVMAIPFFGNTLMGDLFYCTVLFGSYEMAKRSFPKLQLA
ncbi:MAG: hypothetical protein EAZ53_16450 [Bacteroidetes bacterium]|nr:MAG: hypothetical protein EAZ53_16450 [Bacteroidota bacterium]